MFFFTLSTLSLHVQYKGFEGIFFRTMHITSWNNIAQIMLENNEYEEGYDELFFKTNSVSYILFYLYKESIYVITGGYGNNYINRIIEKNFGLYLITKVIKKNNPVVKTLMQNNLIGNQTAIQKTNKKTTSFLNESSMNSIYRQINIEVNREIAEELGIEFDEGESEDKKINIVNKDSIVIKRSISISELKVIIENIYELEKKGDNFPLNYLVLANKKRIKTSDLNKELVNTLLRNDHQNFIISGDDYTAYITAASRYVLKNAENDIIFDQTYPITFEQIINTLNQGKYNKKTIEEMLKKWRISTYDNVDKPINEEISILESLQGFIEYEEINKPCFLFNGSWYIFDEKFTDDLNHEFLEIYNDQKKESDSIVNIFGLKSNIKNENDYNIELMNNDCCVVTHTIMIENVEIADVIFYDSKYIYLMHNKGRFDGAGARDVTNQVLTSCEYLQHSLIRNKKDFLKEYFEKIQRLYSRKKQDLPLSEESFNSIFDENRQIKYIIGYMNGYDVNCRSNYAKYLSVEITKRLLEKGIECNILNIT